MLALSERGMERFIQRFAGRKMDVLWEQVSGATDTGFVNVGLTDNYIRVVVETPEVLTNQIMPVTIAGIDGRSMGGVALASALPETNREGM